MIVTANRKTIGDLNSRMITSTLSSVTVIQEKGRTTSLTVFFYIFFTVPRSLVESFKKYIYSSTILKYRFLVLHYSISKELKYQ